MGFIKNVFENKKNIGILSVCILVLSLVMVGTITGNTYAADTSTDTGGDVGTQATTATVTLVASGGSVSPSTITITNNKYPSLPTPTKDGSSSGFLGWYTSLTETGVKVSAGDTWAGGNYLYAKWSDKVTVTFAPGSNATVNPTSKTVTVGSTYGTLPTPTHSATNDDKWTFTGWYPDSSGGSRVTSSSTVKS